MSRFPAAAGRRFRRSHHQTRANCRKGRGRHSHGDDMTMFRPAKRENTCRQCGVVFLTKASRAGVFCSRACKDASMRILPIPQPRPCVVCGRDFTPSRKRNKARHCSKRCEWEARGGAAYCATMSRESAEQRGNTQRDRGEGRAYRKLNGRHEHRVVAEGALGRPLARGEVVHHIDGDKRNNAPENLEVITQGEHMRRHGLWEKRWPKQREKQ